MVYHKNVMQPNMLGYPEGKGEEAGREVLFWTSLSEILQGTPICLSKSP